MPLSANVFGNTNGILADETTLFHPQNDMHLKIGIDGRVFLNKSGVGHYAFELCKALDILFPDIEFYVYNREAVELPSQNKRWKMRIDEHCLRKLVPRFIWFKFVSGFFCRKDHIDVYWGIGSFLPFFLGSVPTVLTVYDLVYKLSPQTMYTLNLWFFRLFFKSDFQVATKVTSISKGTAERLELLMNRTIDAVVYPSTNDKYFPQSKTTIQKCLVKYGILSPYFLSVATWEPRKNLLLLLKTFVTMKNNGELGDHLIVLVGAKGWKDNELQHFLGKSDTLNSIFVLGYVLEDDLISLYSGATGFLFPSIYEGFGMPVLEARRCGAAVVTTDIPELREAGGENSFYIQPTADGIRDGILDLLSSTRRHLDSENFGPTWKESAIEMERILSHAAFSTNCRSQSQ